MQSKGYGVVIYILWVLYPLSCVSPCEVLLFYRPDHVRCLSNSKEGHRKRKKTTRNNLRRQQKQKQKDSLPKAEQREAFLVDVLLVPQNEPARKKSAGRRRPVPRAAPTPPGASAGRRPAGGIVLLTYAKNWPPVSLAKSRGKHRRTKRDQLTKKGRANPGKKCAGRCRTVFF